jgi:hypothetical protein
MTTSLLHDAMEPPGIDLWKYGEATGRTHAVGQIPD